MGWETWGVCFAFFFGGLCDEGKEGTCGDGGTGRCHGMRGK
jgi:hypothetical protein